MDIANPKCNLTVLGIYSRVRGKQVDLTQIADVELLESLFEIRDVKQYDRVLFFSIRELHGWDELRYLVNTCNKYNIEWSFVREDIHSDVEVPVDYLTGVI